LEVAAVSIEQTAKRARYLKRVRRRASRLSDTPRREPTDRQSALAAAAAEKTKRLNDLRAKYEPKIADLELEYADKRREVWDDYEQRKELIRQAVILDGKK
jgi:hypothetical protein